MTFSSKSIKKQTSPNDHVSHLEKDMKSTSLNYAQWDNSQISAVFESSVDVIITIDPFGNILACNPATTKLFGYEQEELLNHKINKLMPSKEKSEHDGYLKKYASQGIRHVIGQRREVAGQKKDGTIFPIELCVSEAEVNGKKIYTGIIRDITQRKEEEEALQTFARNLELSQALLEQQAANLSEMTEDLQVARLESEEANRTKSEFLANMSHEIRTPMTAILGYTDILLDELEDEPFLHDSASVIKRNGESLLALINDILDLSKVESGQLTVEYLSFSPADTVNQVIKLLKTRADDKGIDLYGEMTERMPLEMISDPTRLRQILVNLIGNAIKFTDQGEVRVTMGMDPQRSGHLCFSVTDTGVGIAPDKTEIIFNPFKQSDNSTTREFGGTGLGLAISKKLVATLEGELKLESQLGKGSTFTVSLPISPKDQEELIAKQLDNNQSSLTKTQNKKTLSDSHILVVEDGEDNMRIIQLFLEKSGIKVTTATNGQEAVDILLSHGNDETCPRFDLVFMDMQMPVLDGYEATRKLRHQNFAGTIVALTAHAMTGDREKCIAAGCDDFLTKPISRKQLIEMIEKHLDLQPADV